MRNEGGVLQCDLDPMTIEREAKTCAGVKNVGDWEVRGSAVVCIVAKIPPPGLEPGSLG